jgi:hypothetical protein
VHGLMLTLVCWLGDSVGVPDFSTDNLRCVRSHPLFSTHPLPLTHVVI